MTGVKGREISFVTGHGLCAAVSEMSAEDGAPPVSELLVYSRVVEDLHRRQAVVPLRYGCFLNGIPSIRDVLKREAASIPCPARETGRSGRDGNPHPPFETETTPPPEEPPADGRDYLTLRKAHYRMRMRRLSITGCFWSVLSRPFQVCTASAGRRRPRKTGRSSCPFISLSPEIRLTSSGKPSGG